MLHLDLDAKQCLTLAIEALALAYRLFGILKESCVPTLVKEVTMLSTDGQTVRLAGLKSIGILALDKFNYYYYYYYFLSVIIIIRFYNMSNAKQCIGQTITVQHDTTSTGYYQCD